MSRSKVAVGALSEVDPQFAVLVETLFGKAVDPSVLWEYVYTPEGVAKMLAADVAKDSPGPADLNTGGPLRKRRGRLMARPVRKSTFRPTGRSRPEPVDKAETWSATWDVEFAKTDTDKRQVFGWATIVEKDGQKVVDRRGDVIDPEEIEKAAYTYVVKSRVGGHQHRRTEDGGAFKASDMIESFVVTDEKVEKMGLPDDTPRGWWVCYHVADDDTWARIKDGRITGFSIHGKGKRQAIGEFSEVL